MPRSSNYGCLISVLLILNCSRAPTLQVVVENIPPDAQSLQFLVTHQANGSALTTNDTLPASDLPMPPPIRATQLLRLPEDFSGEISVNVAAFANGQGMGQILRAGLTSHQFDPMPLDNTAVVDLRDLALSSAECGSSRIRLLLAVPGVAGTTSKEFITLTGWGFLPNTQIYFGDIKSQNVTYRSATSLVSELPPASQAGPVKISIENPGGERISCEGKFRYRYDVVDFTSTTIGINGAADDIYVSDFDKNSQADLALTVKTANRLYISLNSSANVDYLMSPNRITSNITHGDLDRDGDTDLFFATNNGTTGQIWTVLNNGSGSFPSTSSRFVTAGTMPIGISVGDLNGDSFPDLIAADIITTPMMMGRLNILFNDKLGTFLAPINIDLSVVKQPVAIALCDLNADGAQDVIIADAGTARVFYIFNSGKGTFGTPLLIPLTDVPANLVIGDIDGDNREDLIIPLESTDKIYINLSRKTTEAVVINVNLPAGAGPKTAAITDMNGDGLPDLVVGNAGSNQILIFLQKARQFPTDPYFADQPSNVFSIPGAVGQLRKIAIGDLSGDGRPEILIAGDAPVLGILLNRSR